MRYHNISINPTHFLNVSHEPCRCIIELLDICFTRCSGLIRYATFDIDFVFFATVLTVIFVSLFLCWLAYQLSSYIMCQFHFFLSSMRKAWPTAKLVVRATWNWSSGANVWCDGERKMPQISTHKIVLPSNGCSNFSLLASLHFSVEAHNLIEILQKFYEASIWASFL